jgi:hypothetical protein
MNPTIPAFRRVLAVALAAMLAYGLAACGRTTKSFTPAPEATVTWTGTISHLFADRSVGTKPTGCTSCHHAGTTLPDWTDYDTVVSYSSEITTKLGTTVDGTMRQFTGPGEADVILNWIAAGAPK